MMIRRRSEEVPQLVVAVPSEEVGVVPVDQVRGGVVVGLGLSVGSHRQSPGAAVVFVRSRLNTTRVTGVLTVTAVERIPGRVQAELTGRARLGPAVLVVLVEDEDDGE